MKKITRLSIISYFCLRLGMPTPSSVYTPNRRWRSKRLSVFPYVKHSENLRTSLALATIRKNSLGKRMHAWHVNKPRRLKVEGRDAQRATQSSRNVSTCPLTRCTASPTILQLFDGMEQRIRTVHKLYAVRCCRRIHDSFTCYRASLHIAYPRYGIECQIKTGGLFVRLL